MTKSKKTAKPKAAPAAKPARANGYDIRLLADEREEACVGSMEDLDLIALRAARILSSLDTPNPKLTVEVLDGATFRTVNYDVDLSPETIRLARELVARLKAFQLVSGIFRSRLASA